MTSSTTVHTITGVLGIVKLFHDNVLWLFFDITGNSVTFFFNGGHGDCYAIIYPHAIAIVKHVN